MSRTRRFYNLPVRGTWKRFNDILGLFHPFAQRCMGRCRHCRNRRQDQRILRKARTAEARMLVASELAE
jgi:pyruvate-formate lyase-activating enzyme